MGRVSALIEASEANTTAVTPLQKLDVGAGGMAEDGFISMDISPAYSPDFQHDMTQFPWPFEDESMSHVKCFHVLEHLDRKHDPGDERDAPHPRAGWVCEIEVPIFPYWTAIADPTHYTFFVPQTWAYFCTQKSYQQHMRGASIGVDYGGHRKLYDIKEWTLTKAFRNEQGSILRTLMEKA